MLGRTRGESVSSSSSAIDERTIAEFWQAHPCGDAQVGGLIDFADHESFFDAYDAFRYTKESHILDCLDALQVSGKRILEIGLGQGADSEQLIRRGARWSGLDLTQESVERVLTRLELRGLPFDTVRQGTVLDIPWPENSFDVVFSHGVLHHVPDILKAQAEICRVLKPDGELIVMLYSRWSLNYFSIMVLRRIGLAIMYPFLLRFPTALGPIIQQHVDTARRVGFFRYLKSDQFLSRNTDGPLNAYSPASTTASG